MIDKISDEFILGIELEDNIFDGSKVVGSFYKNTGSLEVLNYDGQYSDLVGQEIIITDKGTWYLNKIEYNEADDTAEFEIYDLSHRFDNTYVDVFVSGMTIYEWLQTICNKLDITLGVTSFPNSDYVLETSPYVDSVWTYRNVVQMIAEAGGCFAKFENDELVIRYFNLLDIIAVADWVELSTEDSSEPVNVVVLGNDLEDNIMYPTIIPDNPVELSIDNNEILYLDREGMIQAIYNNVVGTFVTPFSISFEEGMQIGTVKSGVLLSTINKDNEIINVKTMNISSKYTGIWTYTIVAEIPTETETEYQYAGTITTTINETKATVDKANQEIELLVSTTTTQTTQISELSEDLQDTTDNLSNYETVENVNAVRNEVSLLIDSQNATITAIEDIQTNGVSQTVTETGFTFGTDGLIIEDESTLKNTIDTNGILVTEKTTGVEQELLFAGYDSEKNIAQVRSANIEISNHTSLGSMIRFEPSSDEDNTSKMSVFWIGG